MLRQTGTANADEKKALVRSSDGATRVTAKVRVDAWVDGEYARAGVTLFGRYNLVFTGRVPGQKRIEFLHDGVAWSGWPSQAGEAGYATFDWSPGQWYLFEMRIEEGMLIGRVTEVATGRSSAELRFDLARYGWNRTSGLAGVNGGSAGSYWGTSYATASFDDVTVYRATAGTSTGGLVAASAPTRSIASSTANTAAPVFVESHLMEDETASEDPGSMPSWPRSRADAPGSSGAVDPGRLPGP